MAIIACFVFFMQKYAKYLISPNICEKKSIRVWNYKFLLFSKRSIYFQKYRI